MAELQIGQPGQTQVSAQEMLEADEWHDLLPIEKKLISYSLGVGVVLLVVFIFAFGVFSK
ncbi:MAG: hypothetical protein K6T29_08520 [Peptococcaceae bacterium]|nr:hypothetical protein [Peptococcaceae bacterium]